MALLGLSLAFACVAAELVLRLLMPTPAESRRVMMWSSPHFRLDRSGALRYLPNENVRAVAVYDDSIEFDVRYHTNDLGFIDDRNYLDARRPSSPQRLVLVGDSFAGGWHGGAPWISALRAQLEQAGRNVELYNLGVEGAGIQNFAALLSSFGEQKTFTHIVILAISDDFFRPRWRPVTSDSEIRFCDVEQTQSCVRFAVVGYDDSKGEVLARVRRFAAQGERIGLADRARLIAHRSRLLSLVNRPFKDRPAVRQRRLEANVRALRTIKERFPDRPIYFIHLPQKEEVWARGYAFDPQPYVRALGIPYYPALTRCHWSREMFYPKDAHPNAIGYENVARCVSRYLFGSPTPGGR